jgi:Flp pilus assembly protein TadD
MLKPQDARSRIILADLLTDAGDFPAASQALVEASALDSVDQGLRLGRAKLYSAEGRLDEADAVLRSVLDAEPSEP